MKENGRKKNLEYIQIYIVMKDIYAKQYNI